MMRMTTSRVHMRITNKVIGTMERGHFVPAVNRQGICAPSADAPWEVYYDRKYGEFYSWNAEAEESSWVDPVMRELDEMLGGLHLNPNARGDEQNIGGYVDQLIQNDWAEAKHIPNLMDMAIADEELTVQPHDDAPLIDWAIYCHEYYQIKGGWKKNFTVEDWVQHFISEGYSDDNMNADADDSEIDLP